jgi:hypothetical protein
MKSSLPLLALSLCIEGLEAFLVAQQTTRPTTSSALLGTSAALNLPCFEDCALTKYPNLPESIHPGVLSGKAQLDLLKHAKENGKQTNKH